MSVTPTLPNRLFPSSHHSNTTTNSIYPTKTLTPPTKISFPFIPLISPFILTISSKHISKPCRFHSGISSNNSNAPSITTHLISPQTLLLSIYFLIFLLLRLFSIVLPMDFSQRWQNLIVYSQKAETEAKSYPSHLLQAVVAYEDRRFFWHFGVDPVGIARAVLFFPNGGGGSTITQQLVKNIFLTNDRTFSRKAVEMILALILERKLSKSKILGSYLGKIYWGHGIYGIESASYFYFGKHPEFLTLGESALLAGMIPSPELRSPFNDLSRGKISQARALRRMVDAGFLDIQVALSTVNENLDLHGDGEELTKTLVGPLKQEPIELDIWDWRKESKIWEVKEYMDTWATRVRQRKYDKRIKCKTT